MYIDTRSHTDTHTMHFKAAGNIKEFLTHRHRHTNKHTHHMHLQAAGNIKDSLSARSSRSADFIRDKIRQSRSVSTSREGSFHTSEEPSIEHQGALGDKDDGENPRPSGNMRGIWVCMFMKYAFVLTVIQAICVVCMYV